MRKKILTLLILGIVALPMPARQSIQPALKLWYNRPADFFEESMPIGNGKLGALVYGGVKDNTIYLNDLTFWTGKPVDNTTDSTAYRWLPKVREALFREDYALADSLQLHLQGANSQFYQPLGTLHFHDLSSGEATEYRRQLDLDSALCQDSYRKNGIHYTREYFASHPDKLIAIHLKADKRGGIRTKMTLTAQVPHQVKASAGQLTMTGHAMGDANNSIHFCTVVKVDGKDGKVSFRDSTIYLDGLTEATVYIVNETSFNGFDKHPVKEGSPYIEMAMDEAWHTVNYNYETLRHRHVEDYRKYFERFKLALGTLDDKTDYNAIPTDEQLKTYTDKGGGNAYLETLYTQFGRYLLISSSRTPGVPANLQGLWTTHLFSPWRGNYTVNINLEENYWPAEVSNLSEMTQPLFSFMKGLAANGRVSAHHYYGINKGWCSSHNSDLWAMTNPVGEKRESPEWSNWNMGGAWLSQALWEHYAFTQDKEFLKTTALPLLKGASEFMLDWLVENPNKPRELITAPSTSPENEYKTDKGYHGTTCYGGAADLAILRELFANTSKAIALTAPGDKKLKREIDHALARLRPYTIGHMGDINEWYYDWDDWDFTHRHQSHLIGLYPGHHINVAETPALAQAARRSLEIKGDMTTGWSTGWRINLWARLHDGTMAYRLFQKLLTYVSPDNYQGADRRRSGGTYPNLFDAHPPFQIDGNFGGTAGVCEMLVQSSEDRLELLPAIPDAWKNGAVSGLCARGGYEVDMVWQNGKVVKASLKGKTNRSIAVKYNGRIKKVTIKQGKTTVIE